MKEAVRLSGQMTSLLRPPPDFLLIGTKRGGTTSLYRYLLQHPSVIPLYPSPRQAPLRRAIKGTRYFTHHADRPVSWYLGFFPTVITRRMYDARHGQAISGEATPYYLFHPTVAERAARVVPDAKIIAILRHPVERAHSHWAERCREGVETLSFREAIEAETARLGGEAARIAADPTAVSYAHEQCSYVEQSKYSSSIARWMSHYSSSQILILRSEDFYAGTQTTMDALCDHLGIHRHDFDVARRWNATSSSTVSASDRAIVMKLLGDEMARVEDLTGGAVAW